MLAAACAARAALLAVRGSAQPAACAAQAALLGLQQQQLRCLVAGLSLLPAQHRQRGRRDGAAVAAGRQLQAPSCCGADGSSSSSPWASSSSSDTSSAWPWPLLQPARGHAADLAHRCCSGLGPASPWRQPPARSEQPLQQQHERQQQLALPHQQHQQQQARSYHAARTSEYKLESVMIFDSCWRRFEERYGMDFRVPREIVWLNGAPGSGKGVNTAHILKTRGLTKHFTISGLLESYPEARRLVDAGEMIPDTLVGDLLLEALLLDEPGLQDDLGFVVDGFPRTACQVDFVKLLYDKLLELHQRHADTSRGIAFPRPSFKVVVLYVDEETSIKRQLARARVANLHNRRVLDAGAGHFFEERSTDTDIDKCRKRYGIFKTHYAATLRLKQFFPFTLIDAMGSLEETRQQITKELRYQSSLDLSLDTYELIRHLPLAKDVVLSARQELVMRLDGYCEASQELFTEVIDRIQNDVLPIIRQSGLAGHAEYVTRSAFFSEHPVAIDMLVDVLTDRGFHVCHVREDTAVPESVDLASGRVASSLRPVHKFRISFDARGPRDDIKALEIAARMAESTVTPARDVRISHSVIPDHFDTRREDEEDELRAGLPGPGGRVAGFMGS